MKPKFKYKSEDELSPLVKSLIGIIPHSDDADKHAILIILAAGTGGFVWGRLRKT